MSEPQAIASVALADLPTELLDRIVDRLRHARAVQVVGHLRPDGDCIGSMLAMHWMLRHWGVPHALAVEAMPANGYDALEDFHRIAPRPDPTLDPDTVVFLDCATLERGPKNWTPPAPIVNIDHHASNTRYGELNWIDEHAAATGEMLYRLARYAGVPVGPAMADALLTALTTDTGSFRFSNTGPLQHRIAAELIEAGASVERVSRMAYASHTHESLRLAGHVMAGVRLACDGRLAWSEITREDYERMGGEDHAPENLVDALRSIRGVRLALLFHELPGGVMRVNLRSDGSVDVARLAAEWGGGGHRAAAGIQRPTSNYEADRERILARCMTALVEPAR